MIEEYRPGIYYVNREGSIAIQIIVSSELDEKEHKWLNALTEHLNEARVRKLVDVTNELKDSDDKIYADSVWEIVTSQNKEILKRMWEDKKMCKAMAELFKPEIDAAFNNGTDDKGIQVFKNMIKRGFSREEAQSLAEISDELVEKALASLQA